TSVRSYKRPVSAVEARAELAACAGSHFDPKVVRAFLDVSIGRVRPVSGPLAWLGSLPFVSNLPQLGQAATTLGRAAAATVTMAGAVTAGAMHAAALPTGERPGGSPGPAPPAPGRLVRPARCLSGTRRPVHRAQDRWPTRRRPPPP